MTTDALTGKINALAEALVLATEDDADDLTRLAALVLEVGESLDVPPTDRLRSAATEMARLLEAAAAAPEDAGAEALRLLQAFVPVLQAAHLWGRPAAALPLPGELAAPAPDDASPPEVGPRVDALGKALGRLAAVEADPASAKGGVDGVRDILRALRLAATAAGLTDAVEAVVATATYVEMRPASELAPYLKALRAWLADVLARARGKTTKVEPLETLLERLKSGSTAPKPKRPPTGASVADDPEILHDFTVEGDEHLHNVDKYLLILEERADDEEALNTVFRAFHTLKGLAGFLGLEPVRALAHGAESLLDKARKGQLTLTPDALDVIFRVNDGLKEHVCAVRDSLASDAPPLKLTSDPELAALVEAAVEACSTGEGATQPKAAEPPAPASSEPVVLTPKTVIPGRPAPPDLDPRHNLRRTINLRQESVRVDSSQLDQLVELIGELVIAQAMVVQADEIRRACGPRLERQLSHVDKITRQLQEMATTLRMVPVQATFEKMARVARDVARKEDKAIAFCISGEDSTLDKKIVDRLGDPLLHLVRNAICHGVEADTEARVRAGKPRSGKVELRAFHKGGKIHIEVEDDGTGLHGEAILARARERGIVGAGVELSDDAVYQLVFRPGFSTREAVDSLAGRGVGLDVVKEEIESLRGQVEVRSKPGVGTVFSLCLPLTLAMIDGMVVRIGRERYIIPTLTIVRTVVPNEDDLVSMMGRAEAFLSHGRTMPLVRVGRLFSVPDAVDDPTKSLIVVVEENRNQAGLLVDELVGQQQIVIKSLGEGVQGVKGIAGGAVMHDGQIGLILDVGSIVKGAHGGGGAAMPRVA